jgi:NAD(P)-dependent dehydrogenase (short-subunit alcohol dehydrogenase family)
MRCNRKFKTCRVASTRHGLTPLDELPRPVVTRSGGPEDIGRVAAFLGSDDAFWITGQLSMQLAA